MSNQITFGSFEVVSLRLYQFDKTQIIEFTDVPDGAELQFDDGTIKVITDHTAQVPDAFLKTAGAKHAWIQIIDGSETTIKKLNVNVIPRARKDEYVSPDDEETFREQIEAIMENTAAVAQSVRDDADEGEFDGFSPTLSEERIEHTVVVTVTDANGTHTFELYDGASDPSSGDMQKSVYDQNDNGIVDNAEKVNGHTVGKDVPADAVFTDTVVTKTSELTNDSGFLTEHQSLAGYATQSWVEGKGYLTEHQSLAGYATQSWVSSQGYLTEHQSLASYYTAAQTDAAIAAAVNQAIATVDSLVGSGVIE